MCFLILVIEIEGRGYVTRSDVIGNGQMIRQITKAWRRFMRLRTEKERELPLIFAAMRVTYVHCLIMFEKELTVRVCRKLAIEMEKKINRHSLDESIE